MLWGHTFRSPHAHARIASIDVSRSASPCPGVHAVLTHDDVPGEKSYGLEFADQPVLAIDRVLYFGEPVALVAAEHPEQARRAAEAGPRRVRAARARGRHGAGARGGRPAPREADAGPRLPRRPAAERRAHRRDPSRRPRRARATSPSRARTSSAARTRRSSAPSPGSRCPTARAASTSTSRRSGCTSTAARSRRASGCRSSRCASTSPASAARSAGAKTSPMQIHAVLLAMNTNRPVKIVYSREESFSGSSGAVGRWR